MSAKNSTKSKASKHSRRARNRALCDYPSLFMDTLRDHASISAEVPEKQKFSFDAGGVYIKINRYSSKNVQHLYSDYYFLFPSEEDAKVAVDAAVGNST